MAITSSALTQVPNDGTIKGADTNRSIGYTTDTWRNESKNKNLYARQRATQKKKKERKKGRAEKRKRCKKHTQTNEPCFVQAAVTVVF